MLAPPILEKLRKPWDWPVMVHMYLSVTVGEDARYRKDRGIMLVVMEARRAIEGVLATA